LASDDPANPTLHANVVQNVSLTSLAPSATTAVITSLVTAVAPREHGATGWVTWCREIGAQILPLPFTYRAGGDLASSGFSAERVFYGGPSTFERVMEEAKRECFQVLPKEIARSAFTDRMQRGGKIFAFDDLHNMFEIIEWIAARQGRNAFVYAYSDAIGLCQHRYGPAGPETKQLYSKIDCEVLNLSRSLKGKQVTIVLTSDHGFRECPPQEAVFLDEHPQLANMLRMPLCGEPRFAYCYLKPDVETDFIAYINQHLSGRFYPIRARSPYAEKLFGNRSDHPEFAERIGDYILVAQGGSAIYDPLVVEGRKAFRGHHGSLLPEEMLVPLIMIRA
jgi:hypothetical protein